MLSFTNERKKNCQDIYCKSVTHKNKKSPEVFVLFTFYT